MAGSTLQAMSPSNARLLLLLSILLLILLIFIGITVVSRNNKKDLSSLTQEDGPVYHYSELCLKGSQSDRGRYCPEVIRNLSLALQELNNACEKNPQGNPTTVFLGRLYSCKNREYLHSRLNSYMSAIQKR